MIFRENSLLADDSHEISYLILFRKLGKMLQNSSSAAVVIGTLRVKPFPAIHNKCCRPSHLLIIFGSLYSKQYGPRCSLITVHTICCNDESNLKCILIFAADKLGRQHFRNKQKMLAGLGLKFLSDSVKSQ